MLEKLERSVRESEAALADLRAKKAAVLAAVGAGSPSKGIREELIGFSVDEEIAEARIKAALKDLREHFEREVDAELAELPGRQVALDDALRAAWREAGQMVEGGLRILKQMGPPAARLIDGIERGVSSLGEFEAPLWSAGAAEAGLLPEPKNIHEEISQIRGLQNSSRDRGLKSMRINGKFDRALARIRSERTKK